MKIVKNGTWTMLLLLILSMKLLICGDSDSKNRFAVGLGWGIPYGSMVGVQSEYHPKISDRVGICLAAGFTNPDILGFAFGFRGYFLEKRQKLQPFASVYLGSVGMGRGFSDHTLYGFTIGGGGKYAIIPKLYLVAELNFILFGCDWNANAGHLHRLLFSFGIQYYL